VSYDVHLEIDTGGEHPAYVTENQSPTYNLGPMFCEALGAPLRSLDGKLASEALPIVSAALVAMAADPAKFKALNPSNGWGDFDGAINFLRWLQSECSAHPKATVRV